MQKKLDKQVYKIYKKVIYDKQYRMVATRHTKAIDILQEASNTFSKEQWRAIEEYQASTMELCNLMVTLALKK